MSQFKAEYETFFTSPAGISLLTWLQEQRISEHDKAEREPVNAPYFSQAARAYGEILQHIDSSMMSVKVSPYSSRAGNKTSSTGLGTSQ